jgi:hypothetical protein
MPTTAVIKKYNAGSRVRCEDRQGGQKVGVDD